MPDSGGVVFVPALTGLGAPDWDPTARGSIVGITRGTTAAHLARATLDAIAFQVRDVVDLMVAEAAVSLPSLAVDGGAAASDLLCQLQADHLHVPVRRPTVVETTGLGAASRAGLGTGVWGSTSDLQSTWNLDRQFDPGPRDEQAHRRWRSGVELFRKPISQGMIIAGGAVEKRISGSPNLADLAAKVMQHIMASSQEPARQ